MNSKGFAITSIIYGLMLLFVLTISSFLAVLVGKNRRMESITEGIYESIKYEVIEKSITGPTTYTTEKRAKYVFTEQGCSAYLPKNTVLITKETYYYNINESSTITGDDLYYCIATGTNSCNGGTNIASEFKPLDCIS